MRPMLASSSADTMLRSASVVSLMVTLIVSQSACDRLLTLNISFDHGVMDNRISILTGHGGSSNTCVESCSETTRLESTVVGPVLWVDCMQVHQRRSSSFLSSGSEIGARPHRPFHRGLSRPRRTSVSNTCSACSALWGSPSLTARVRSISGAFRTTAMDPASLPQS